MPSQQMKPGGLRLASTPLWKRVPSQDADGSLLSDFMILIPGLSRHHDLKKQQVCDELQQVLSRYDEQVVFAEMNLKHSLLWVSLKPVSGLLLELVAAIQQQLPEAVLVANQAEVQLAANHRITRRRRWSIAWRRVLRLE
ncbi:MAG: hypothetical protein GY696_10560 [Gammaproteobacteria bacterium]|nr:hypothetical protein [Gammaproteobacteria bacterium]